LIDSNAELAEFIFCAGFRTFVAPNLDSDQVASILPENNDPFQAFSAVMDHLGAKGTASDSEKARSCVNQFYREWSAEGRTEREKCFTPILSALASEYSLRRGRNEILDKKDLHILVPGAGLGRLVFEICKASYSVEGNEISYHEIMASSLILNHISKPGQFQIAPFALNCSNHLSRADQFRTYDIPDVHPASELSGGGNGEMSMSMGDFIVLYSKPEYTHAFDAVATVFFIDTAPNILRYIETVQNCLKRGGLWINLGPLLWHSRTQDLQEDADDKMSNDGDIGIADPGSVELTDDEVMALVQHYGFSIEKHEPGAVETGYITNPRSMLQSTYRASFWVARRT
jgi:carnosine N-methyltransferase